ALRYDCRRRDRGAAITLERARAITPSGVDAMVARAILQIDWKADSRPLHQVIDEIRAKSPADVERVAEAWLTCALAERDAGWARAALNASGENPLSDDVFQFSHPYIEGLIARMTNENDKAEIAFTVARAVQEK